MKNFLHLIPEGTLLPYQLRWLQDSARFKMGLWARQTGKDFTCMCEAVWDCVLTPNSLWIVMATGKRQASPTHSSELRTPTIARMMPRNKHLETGEASKLIVECPFHRWLARGS